MLKINDKVKFAMFDNEYTVHACNERYAICVDEASEEKFYSITDNQRNIRGTHNSYGHGTISRDQCEEVLALLSDETNELDISHRNNVPLDIEAINGQKV
ncbi:hypothetical protein QL898_05555 [Psychrobacter sp. APC 3279]|uniref:hypothetical protein n=1 Tax=Psychrobacter sp. APC 3279 TaxID=3035189 RepID=UPI0025B507F9|nr:hypothetical protein [Psychrobacter sp. APC 3279]MDN3441090.1 hypothetical protein [Psychrobacter sp. APC 3279]